MKQLKTILMLALLFSMTLSIQAQAPYKHSIGVTVGSMQAISYKTFPTDHFAIQLDLGTKYNYSVIAGFGSTHWSMELAPSFIYEGHFVKGLYGLVGGGFSLGFTWYPPVSYYIASSPDMQIHKIMGKGGAHGIIGLEYKFNIPLTLQLDFRPGYFFQFNHEFIGDHTFEWGLVNLGVRYTL